MNQVQLQLASDGEHIPGNLVIPDTEIPVAGALLLHGWSSYKEQMQESAGVALLRCGIATLAIDLPLHGSREGNLEALSLSNPLAIVQTWRRAVRDVNDALNYLAQHPLVDPRRVKQIVNPTLATSAHRPSGQPHQRTSREARLSEQLLKFAQHTPHFLVRGLR